MASNTSEEPATVRRRKTDKSPDCDVDERPADMEEKKKPERKITLEPNTYWLTRIVLLRSLCFVYFVAFLVAIHQNHYLLGSNGLLPVPKFLRQVRNIANGDMWEQLQRAPTILWFLDWEQNVDYYLNVIAYCGLAVSGFVVVTGCANMPLMLLLWALYHSIVNHCDVYLEWLAYAGLVISGFVVLTGCANMVMMLALWVIYHSIANVGQTWYSFGWESQILETGFLAVFLCPLLSLRQVPRLTPPSIIVMWGFRWLIFRIMLGAGLIKIRGDKCWRDLTCMHYHYQTQPVPNPMAYYMHQSPHVFHKFEVLSNHFIELVAPFFLVPFLPRRFRLVGGFLQVMFQVVLIISGNLSFLNWLTIIPSLACFDDKSLAWLFSSRPGWAKRRVWEIQQEEQQGRAPRITIGVQVRALFDLSLAMVIGVLSVPVVMNLLSPDQVMNTSFESLRIVNTYGAFGRSAPASHASFPDQRVRQALELTLGRLIMYVLLRVATTWWTKNQRVRQALDLTLGLLILWLSVPVLQNMASSQQKMNKTYDSLRLVNTYGKFGSITKERTEVILQGTYDGPNNPKAKWIEYEFKCKPGSVNRRPCIISPYHYRLDWLMWFAAFGSYQEHPWLVHLSAKLLANDPGAEALIANNPFHGKPPPMWIRAEHYRYVYTKPGSREHAKGNWWRRKRVGSYMPAISLDTIKDYMKAMKWEQPTVVMPGTSNENGSKQE